MNAQVDWSTLRQRLEAAARQLEPTEPSEAMCQQVLQARARAAARVPPTPSDDGFPIVEFELSYERYAIELSWVQELVPLRDLVTLPGTPAYVGGIANVRGRVVSALDLKRLLDVPPKGLPDASRLMVIGRDGFEIGLLVDAVPGVRVLQATSLQPPPPALGARQRHFLRGVAEGPLALLDAAAICADPRLRARAARGSPSDAIPTTRGN